MWENGSWAREEKWNSPAADEISHNLVSTEEEFPMDHLLGLFGKQDQEPEPSEQQSQTIMRESGAVWEFEMPLKEPHIQGQGGQAQGQDQEQAFSIPGGVPLEAVDLQESTIEGYFANIGWTFEKIDQGLWILKYKGGAKDYDIFVELTPQYLVLVVPILERVREGCKEKLWYHLLRLNYMTNIVRFGLNKRDEVLLTLELPIGSISYQEFQKGVQHLCTIVDDAFPEILFLSQKIDALSSFVRESQASM
jgi:hypothetical protein